MNEKDKPDTSQPVSQVSAPIQEPEKSNAIPEAPSAEDQLAKVEEEMTGFEKSTLRWAKTAVIMSAIAAVFVCLQWVEMHQGGVDTRHLVAAAGNQAYAACVNAQISRRALIEVQNSEQDARNATRAASYQAIIAAESAAPVINMKNAATPTFEDNILVPVDIQNIGKTDARNVHAKVRAVFIGRNDDPDFAYKRNQGVDLDTRVLRAGVGTTNGGTPITAAVFEGDNIEYRLKDGDVAAYKSGKKDVVLYGFVSYRDIFAVSHWRQFCSVFQVFKPGLLENNGHPKCSDYNKEDINSPVTIESLGVQTPIFIPNIECIPPRPE